MNNFNNKKKTKSFKKNSSSQVKLKKIYQKIFSKIYAAPERVGW